MDSKINEDSESLINTKETKGWFEYQPSYDGTIFHINSLGAKIFGFNSPDDVIGKKVNELYTHPLFRKFLN